MNGYPEKYQILPAPLERVINVAQRLGKFLGPQQAELCLSEHHREPVESVQPQLPFTPMTPEKARQVAHYILMAEQAKYENRS